MYHIDSYNNYFRTYVITKILFHISDVSNEQLKSSPPFLHENNFCADNNY